jgi:uncharacterized membrane protein
VMRRGLWIFALAFLFRVQAWVLGWSAPGKLFKVDILNVMGPAIVAAAALWGQFRTPRARCVAFAAATLAFGFLTPMVRAARFLDPLPDALEAYLRPMPASSTFSFFPWAGFVFAGGLVGVLIDGVRSRETESPMNASIFAGGAAVAIAAWLASSLPSPFAGSTFWGSSPAFFLLRAGAIAASVGLAYAWDLRPWARRWSPMQQLGRTSLFIYWIHVEMVYGLISLPLHRNLTHGEAWIGVGVFSLFMLLCSVAKDRVVAWWSDRIAEPPAPVLVAP